MDTLKITDPDVRRIRKALEALVKDTEENRQLGHCMVALAHTLHTILRRYDNSGLMPHADALQTLMRGITADIGWDRSEITQKQLMRGTRNLLKWYGYETTFIKEKK